MKSQDRAVEHLNDAVTWLNLDDFETAIEEAQYAIDAISALAKEQAALEELDRRGGASA